MRSTAKEENKENILSSLLWNDKLVPSEITDTTQMKASKQYQERTTT